MTWHNTSHHIASNDVTITWPDPATDIKTSKHFTSKHKTSPPWNGRRLVHSKEMIWASRWSVALRTFYRQILSVLYSSFPFGNFRPRLVRALLVSTYIYIFYITKYLGIYLDSFKGLRRELLVLAGNTCAELPIVGKVWTGQKVELRVLWCGGWHVQLNPGKRPKEMIWNDAFSNRFCSTKKSPIGIHGDWCFFFRFDSIRFDGLLEWNFWI